MQQKNEKFRDSVQNKQKRNKPKGKIYNKPEKKDFHKNENRTADKFRGFSEKDSIRKSSSSKKNLNSNLPKKQNFQRFEYEDNYIFWCRECNLPLIGKECGRCGNNGDISFLSQPADVRFCSLYEREIINRQLFSTFGCNPIGDRLILLNKISGEDKTDEVLVDGFIFGILRFEIPKESYSFEPSLQGAKILLMYAESRKVELKKNNRHFNGKKVATELVESFMDTINKGDFVLVTAGNLTGYGVSYINGEDFSKLKNLAGNEVHTESTSSIEAGANVLRIRRIDSSRTSLHPETPDLSACIEANKKHLKALGKNAINTIRGIVARNENISLPVYVSFSGGKDSLVSMDLARVSLKQRELKAFFLNTGIEFPETVEFVRISCQKMGIPLEEINAGSAFWDQIGKFGPPAKDFRWCCKVCKLAPAGTLDVGKGISPFPDRRVDNDVAYLTIDGKRKHESFSRARVMASETNPFVPSQLNIFPIRNWKALEVWLYIYWRELSYNPLYDLGFERIGCWLCPSALAAEYSRVKELHPEMHEKWNSYLLEWAKTRGLSEKFIEYGFWRWKELPPKIRRLAEEHGIFTLAKENFKNFEIEVVGGISPCRSGGFSIEAGIKGIREKEIANYINVLGNTVYVKEMGILLVKTSIGTVKFFSSGNLFVSSETKEKAISLFKNVTKQLIRFTHCTGCGICIKACPIEAIFLNERRLYVSEKCIRCGKCAESCIVIKYFDKFVPDIYQKLKI